MTNEEAIKRVKGYLTDYLPIDCYGEVEEIIKALEQEPFINKLCVSEKACEHDKQQVLKKIRVEIEEYKSRQLTLAIGVADLEEGKQIALEYVLAILDKVESEDKE